MFHKQAINFPDIPITFNSYLRSVSSAIANTISPERHEYVNSLLCSAFLGLCACTKHRRDGTKRAESFTRRPRTEQHDTVSVDKA